MKMKNFNEKLIEKVNELVVLTEDTMELAECPFEECFPTLSNFLVNVDGKDYKVTLEIKVNKI